MDVEIRNHGQICLFIPRSPAGTSWLSRNIKTEQWQQMGPAIAVDYKQAPDIYVKMLDSDLDVRLLDHRELVAELEQRLTAVMESPEDDSTIVERTFHRDELCFDEVGKIFAFQGEVYVSIFPTAS